MAAQDQTALEALFGTTVQGKSGDVAVSSLADLEAVGVYFSAHWCPPCRGFTPKLAEYYKKMKDSGKKFEIIFVSSDKEDGAFNGYYADMPWLALPFADRKRKAKLSKKFKVDGIPSFQIIDPQTGRITNSEGRDVVTGDPEGKDFPWTKPPPKSFFELAAEISLKKHKSDDVSMTQLQKDNKYVIVYFSAHWCPPCRNFTPKFAEWYKKNQPKLAGTERSFDVIFVSSDRQQDAFEEYWNSQPWLALPFEERALKATISKNMDVKGIPTVQVLDTATGKVVTDSGRTGVMTDPEAAEFPWPKKSIEKLAGPNIDPINNTPMLVVFASDNKEGVPGYLETLKPIADEYLAKSQAADDDMEIAFRVDEGCDFTGRLKGLLPTLGDNKVVIVDISMKKFKGGFPDLSALTTDAARTFVNDFLDESKEDQLEDLKM